MVPVCFVFFTSSTAGIMVKSRRILVNILIHVRVSWRLCITTHELIFCRRTSLFFRLVWLETGNVEGRVSWCVSETCNLFVIVLIEPFFLLTSLHRHEGLWKQSRMGQQLILNLYLKPRLWSIPVCISI